jgi:hypothetical protein
MTREQIAEQIDSYWVEAEAAVSGLGGADHALLNIAIGAVDMVWDRNVFDRAESFGGTEIGFARGLSAAILARLLNADYAAIVSVAGTEMTPSGDATLDDSLASAAREALDTFAGDLLGPVTVGDLLVYAQPMILDSPVPIGAVVLATREPMAPAGRLLLKGFLGDLDTRLNLAEQMLKLRRTSFDLGYEVRKLKGEISVPAPDKRAAYVPLPENIDKNMSALAGSVSAFDLFGAKLPGEHFEAFCRNFAKVTGRYLEILNGAEHLYLDVPSGVDAKDVDSKYAAPYRRLLEIMGSLRGASRLLYHTTTEDLAPCTIGGGTPNFADLTRVAKGRADDEITERILDIMNDQGEEAELDAVAARHHPYEFRVANIGEVFALLALHQTLKEKMPESFRSLSRPILAALPNYQGAKAYLLSYDLFEDVPLKGVDRTQPPDAEKLLLYREKAPSFGLLLTALSR